MPAGLPYSSNMRTSVDTILAIYFLPCFQVSRILGRTFRSITRSIHNPSGHSSQTAQNSWLHGVQPKVVLPGESDSPSSLPHAVYTSPKGQRPKGFPNMLHITNPLPTPYFHVCTHTTASDRENRQLKCTKGAWVTTQFNIRA